MKNPLLRDDFSLFHPLRMGLDRKALFFYVDTRYSFLAYLVEFFLSMKISIPSFGMCIPSLDIYIPNFETYIPKLGIKIDC